MSEKVWFITGASRGFGREWAMAALERGDKVAATARDTDTLADLVETYGSAILPIQLDVTDRTADFAAVKRAHDHFGRLDSFDWPTNPDEAGAILDHFIADMLHGFGDWQDAMAAGEPQLIPHEDAVYTRENTASPIAGWLSFQPLWQEICRTDPELFE